MSQNNETKALAAHFRLLNARDPERWASSQINEGIPQYARFVFLREAWKGVVREGDSSWIDGQIDGARKNTRGPGAGIGPVLERLLAAGVNREDITELVRVMQWRVLCDLTYQLADPGVVDYPDDKMPRVNWALFELDEQGKPIHEIDALHESVLDTEPSGREMRPKGVTRSG